MVGAAQTHIPGSGETLALAFQGICDMIDGWAKVAGTTHGLEPPAAFFQTDFF
jgi:hypothetical protein